MAFNWSEESFRNEFSFADTWVSCADEKILGFICLRDAGEAWEISILATEKQYQRQGHMESFLTELLAQLGDQRHFWLEVHELNLPAQRLYQKLSFQRDGRRGGYYRDGSAAILMSLHRPGLKT